MIDYLVYALKVVSLVCLILFVISIIIEILKTPYERKKKEELQRELLNKIFDNKENKK